MAKLNDTLSFLVAPKLTMTLWIVEAINKGLAKRKQIAGEINGNRT